MQSIIDELMIYYNFKILYLLHITKCKIFKKIIVCKITLIKLLR